MRAKVISIIIFIVFSLFAYWQVNDSDPGLWVTIYGLIALVSLLRLFGVYSRPITSLFMIACLVYSFWYIGGFFEWLGSDEKGKVFGTMTPEYPYVELTREYLGLLMAFFGLLLHVRTK